MSGVLWEVGMLVTGYQAWKPLEYLGHRFFGHVFDTSLRDRHLSHHKDPFVYRFDPYWSVAGSALAAICALFCFSLGLFAWGIFGGYAVYEYRHWRFHEAVGIVRHNSLADRHQFHHADVVHNFGVTSRVWDWIGRTSA